MDKKTVKLFDLNIFSEESCSLEELLSFSMKKSTKTKIAKVNSEFLLRALEDEPFKKVLTDFDLIIPDGRGVLWAAKFLSLPSANNKLFRIIQALIQMIYTGASLIFYPKYCTSTIAEAFPGRDCFYLMLKVAEKEGRSVYFFGASRKVLLESVNIIRKDFPNLEISGFSDGYTDKGLKVIGKINRTKAEVLFVALGSPEQEEWITKNIQKLETVKVAIGEGGTFDFIGGNSKKPPKFINSLGLEWFWRTFFSPNKTTNAGSRVKRVWRAVPVFIYKTVKYKIKNIEGPNEEN